MDDELKSGAMLGRYELLVRIGRGGMASVWVARERAPVSGKQRLVAVKAMLPELARHYDFRVMFLDEGQIVQSIDHHNVVKVHEVSEDRGILYMAMEWVEGDSLRTLIKEARRRRPIPPEMAVKIISDTAAGLHAAHELRGWDGALRNLVHCDVSPHNILVGLDGRAKLVDFGVANATAHSDVAQVEKIKGKFAYMSPEQASAQKLDRRSDVFALGIVLFELTTGERLFRGENPAHTLDLVSSGKIPNPVELNPDYPPGLAQIVLKALERDVSRRYQTALEFREALDRYLIDSRIMVAHTSVGSLVKRVLGPRVESQRQALREALTAADGVVEAGLIPDQPAGSGTNFNTAAVPSAPFNRHFSEPPSGISKTGPTPHPQTLEQAHGIRHPEKAKGSFAPALVALFGLGAAASAIFWAQYSPSQPAPLVTAAATFTQTASPAAAGTQASGTATAPERGISIDNLPLVAEQRAVARARTTSVARTKASSEPAEPSPSEAPAAEAATAIPEATSAEPVAPELVPEPAPEKPKPAAPVLPPNDQRPPLNRGAAIAALGSKSTTVAGCKRADGPSGGGRVSVTFSPDGPVSKVSVAAPFAGTSVGACIASVYQSARVPAFSGSSVTLPHSFRIPD